MEIFRKSIAYPKEKATWESCFKLKDCLLYDIETTGLNPKNARLYLIGVLLFHEENMELIQYFAENVCDEAEMLEEFFSLCKEKKTLISFNGEGFDNRFIESMAKTYGKLPLHLKLHQIDLFKLIRKRKKFYELESCSLKSCERFLGINREDRYSGGELISIYLEYLQDKDCEKKQLLLLHNLEDIQNLPALFSFLAYENIFQGNIRFQRVEYVAGNEILQFSLPFSVPIALNQRPKNFLLELRENTLRLTVPLYQGKLCYFFKDYKDYEFIPSEDRAVHKSLASMYPKEMREKAKAKTAYQKMNTSFLPVFHEEEKVFKKNYQDKQCFIPYKENTFDAIKAKEYLLQFLESYF